VQGGSLPIVWQCDQGPREKTINLTRAHLEEDAGKSLHEDAMRTLGGAALAGMSGIDLNRAGTPLLEIVTEPEMRSSAEAVAYAKALHGLVTWLGICDGNMQEGSFRVDANVSVRPVGQAEFGTRCEIKNLNSFRFMERAIEFEVRRQIELIEDGGRVIQETRLYDPDRDETRPMRSKEDAHDYRYFPDPDLPPLVVDAALIERVRASMPELPGAMRERLIRDLGLSPYDAVTLTATRSMARFFEDTVAALPDRASQAKTAANWVMGDLAAQLNRESLPIDDCPVSPAQLALLIRRIADGTVSGKMAREVFQAIFDERRSEPDAADLIIEARGLKQISDTGELDRIVDEVLAANAKSVEEFRAGKEKAFNSLVGQAMKATRGKANPQQVNDLLRRKLTS
jgi:aspartyl-tRNA(Asn)/glutamyl-tRNA(Gln) amidotransferase subunit B